MLEKSQIIDIVQLINSENLGPVTFYKLINKFGSPQKAIENIYCVKKVKLMERNEALHLYEQAKSCGAKIITYLDASYPQRLKTITDAPPLLYVLGNIELLNHVSSISIVGARNASINGRKTASRIAYDLTNSGVVVVSGMARGIDTAAHKGAMYACNQQGPTIAVLGTGIDVPYPDENIELYKQITKQGCIISEFAPGTLPQTGNFPRRNKTVAALSIGTLIVEATQNSGSLITAKLAADYGKHLFAIPGTPDEARSVGPNSLIKSGAILTESAKDILETIHTDKSPNIKAFSAPKQIELLLDVDEQNTTQETFTQRKIIDYLNFDGVYVDEIIRASGLSKAEVALELLELEMVGKIERQSGNKVALIKRK